jgi:uncharacterized damage-inducible protein DinB
MNSTQSLIRELEQEAATTRRLLAIVPTEKLEWAPHAKSMTLGQLAMHIANIPGNVTKMIHSDGMDVRNAKFAPPQPKSTEEIVSSFDSAMENALEILKSWDEVHAGGPWRMSKGEEEVFTLPRTAVARTIMLNHWYHHRGQLTVYLRLLDVPLPVTYGRSADTNPFA